MIKKYIAILMCAVTISLTACGTTVENVSQKDEPSMFVVVEGGPVNGWCVVYHKETKVMYVVSAGSYNCGNFTLLVNPDGTPMLWEEQ